MDHDYTTAKNKLTAGIDVTPFMAYVLMNRIKAAFSHRLDKLEFLVAPYEADAQLCYLSQTGYVDYVLTCDSDLVAFGCKSVLYSFQTNLEGH